MPAIDKQTEKMTGDRAPLSVLSRNNARVFETLRRANQPLSAYQILGRLRSEGVSAPATVYRALTRLINDGFVHRIETLNAYALCVHPNHDASPLFAVCDNCGGVKEFLDETITSSLTGLAKNKGFIIGSACLEIIGLCAECKSGSLESTGAFS